jgi:cytochrome c2
MGHRNTQGLTVAPDGRVWSTEHGPQGGDEVNRIVPGGNYGWPLATYGVQYGQDSWPLAAGKRDHGEFIEPALAFVPSIGISNLIAVSGTAFPAWTGDLLVSSLRDASLHRLRTRDDRILYDERIHIGPRIRDIKQGKDGRILLWTDAARILVLSRAAYGSPGERAYAACVGCHGAALEGTPLGPPLRGVVGKRVASDPSFTYSPALRQVGGNWTIERLHVFLKNPNGFAEGTSMNFPGVPDSIAFRLIGYLRAHAGQTQ